MRRGSGSGRRRSAPHAADSSGARRRRDFVLTASKCPPLSERGVDYPQWFTAERQDLRGSNALKVAATEFEAKDSNWNRVAVGWSWDLPVVDGRPLPRAFHGRAWKSLTKERARAYTENKCRVP